MLPSQQNACLIEIQNLWLASKDVRPDVVWIAEHEPISADSTMPKTPVSCAWLLSDRGIERRAAVDHVRFILVHSGAHWASGMYPSAASIFNTRDGSKHSIGLAAFAAIQGSDLVYLDFQWAGAYGRAANYHYNSGNENLDFIQEVWFS